MDCAFCQNKGGEPFCTILDGGVCRGRPCSFAKTEEEKAASIQYVYQHLRSLPDKRQREISNKYYRGKMPWRTREFFQYGGQP